MPIVEMMIVSPLEVGARLSHLWSKRYKAAGDSGVSYSPRCTLTLPLHLTDRVGWQRASFWEVQRLVLERLQAASTQAACSSGGAFDADSFLRPLLNACRCILTATRKISWA